LKQQAYKNVVDEIDDETMDVLYTYNKMPTVRSHFILIFYHQDQKEVIEKEVLTDLDYLIDCLLTRHKIVRSDKKAIEVSQIQQIIRQTALRQKALQGDVPAKETHEKRRRHVSTEEDEDEEPDLDIPDLPDEK
jgi:hypothetical protein